MYYAYLLRCADGTLYGGYTVDLARRLRQHNSGKGSKYVRARRPAVLVYSQAFSTKEEAMRREYALKHLSRAEKLALIAEYAPEETP